MIKWNESRLQKLWVKASSRKDSVAALVHRTAGWDIVAASTAHDWSIYLGYAVIVTISLRLYLGYLDRYYSNS